MNCILPQTWGPFSLGGSACDVLWFDLDMKLSLCRILQLLKSRITDKINEHRGDNKQMSFSDLDTMVDESLSRFRVCRCRTQLEFAATLRAISNTSSYDRVKLIVVDSLDCFYWQERFANTFKGIK
eukprot:TRINITY_DN8588_c0_g1_i15.p1 TRINITY_DN8588_c0_g1~~TRINITY_DN8588_c0_g1_i15.p1  ORF type:complete len:126 (-),score=11.26 TRINITY_DN8588_c0_g1_i15:1024-1401(-)